MVERVAPADDPDPVAAAVENLLVVDGIVWTPSLLSILMVQYENSVG